MSTRHPFVQLARAAIEEYVRTGDHIQPPPDLSSRRSSGVFVSIYLNRELRGCIGTIEPQRATLGEEIIENAINAATRDPRFDPIQANELDALEISVDVLTPPIAISSIHDQDPKRHGLIVQSKRDAWKRGLLLPNLESIDTAEKQLRFAREMKAGITDPDEPIEMYRFQVTRYH